MYKVIGIVKGQIRIEFTRDKQELVFSTKEEAEQFIQSLKESKSFPENYGFSIEEVNIESI